jgi:hypothetical protein
MRVRHPRDPGGATPLTERKPLLSRALIELVGRNRALLGFIGTTRSAVVGYWPGAQLRCQRIETTIEAPPF